MILIPVLQNVGSKVKGSRSGLTQTYCWTASTSLNCPQNLWSEPSEQLMGLVAQPDGPSERSLRSGLVLE